MSISYEELKAQFINNPQNAIITSQSNIVSITNFKAYSEFYSYHLANARVSTCQKEWSTPQMSIHCADCAIDKQSCVCLPCFLNGNHQGHEIVIHPISTGNCDCGDLSAIKLAGCCTEHRGLQGNDHPENYLDEKLRNFLTDIVFKAAFASMPHIQGQSIQKIESIFRFLSSFLQFGDGFRRLIAISLTEKIKFQSFFSQSLEFSYFFNQEFRQFCGRLSNDQLFRTNFAKAAYDVLLQKIIPEVFTSYITQMNNQNYSIWSNFWFHSFSPLPLKSAIEKFNWDWVNFLIQYSIQMKTFFTLPKKRFNSPAFLNSISDSISFAADLQPNEQTQQFFDELFSKVLNCGIDKRKPNEMNIAVSFYEMHDDYYYLQCSTFIEYFYDIFNCFKNKKNLKLDTMIEEIDKNLDISQIFCIFNNSFGKENDLFVAKYIDKIDDISKIVINNDSMINVKIEDHFKSFHNGGAFFYTLPLFDALLYIFRQDDLCRSKIAHLLSLKKYKNTKIKLAIVALKKLIALFSCHQDLVSKRNYSILHFILPMLNESKRVIIGIPLVFPVVQLLLGLQSDEDDKKDEFSIKEFFAFEAARELGVFDDFDGIDYKDENVEEKKKQMIISFLYLFILFNVERTLFNFDYYKFMEEQIIFALKQGVSSPADLNKVCNMFYISSTSNIYLNKILSSVAKVKTNNKGGNNDISFSLKDGIIWKPLSAIIPFNDQKAVINKEISKNANSLMKIPEFEDEKDYFFNENNEEKPSNELKIKLKEILSTPTVLSIVYHTLSTNDDKIELEDHLAMNILILISKFVEDFETNNQYDSSTVIHYDSTIFDLIQQMKKILFNYEVDKDGNAMITNTLNKENFKRFLSIKISSDKQKPKSMIDLLIGKGEIGKSVLRQLSIDVKIDGENTELNDQQATKEMKKQKAKIIKQNIIDQYKTIISNFYENEIDSPDESTANLNDSKNDEEVCSICSSTKEDELLSYPLYIYKTKFPFIVDKPPLVLVNNNTQLGVDENKTIENHFRVLPDLAQQQSTETGKMIEKRITEGNNYVIQFSICQHLVHQSCVNSEKTFKCPVDRSKKNGFLPSLDKLSPSSICDCEMVDISTVDDKVIESITSFISNFSDFFENKDADLFSELAKSIAGLISTYEIRLRNLPDCLDSNKNKSLSRNLFLTTWYAYRITDKPEIMPNNLTIFQRFIIKLIQCDELEGINAEQNKNDIIKNIISSFINEFKNEEEIIKEKQIFLFLRRVCLSNYFLLKIEIDDYQNNSKFIDWDGVLSVSNLSMKFDVPLLKLKCENGDDFEFKPINFVKLPKEFLRFAEKPFNFPVDQSLSLTTYDILDYNGLIKNFDDFNEKAEENDQIIQSRMNSNARKFQLKNYPEVILYIGAFASRVEVIYDDKKIQLKPFYFDKFGCPDIGFRRGQQLFLNEEKYGRVMDLILSGDFSFYIGQGDDLDELNLNNLFRFF